MPTRRGEAGAGSGLGLAICRGFVEANGGRIVLQSGRDSGTSFTVSFPVARQPADAQDAVSVLKDERHRARASSSSMTSPRSSGD